jgi:UV DNA damage repair endonuclease
MSKMNMMLAAKRESRMIITTSTSSIRLSTALRKPAVVRVETILAVDLVEWPRAANTPPMMRMTSKLIPVMGRTLSGTIAAPDAT